MPFESPRVTSPLKCMTLSAVVHVISSTSFKRPSEAEHLWSLWGCCFGILLRYLEPVLIKMAAAAIAAAEVAAEAVAEAVAETAAGKNK